MFRLVRTTWSRCLCGHMYRGSTYVWIVCRLSTVYLFLITSSTMRRKKLITHVLIELTKSQSVEKLNQGKGSRNEECLLRNQKLMVSCMIYEIIWIVGHSLSFHFTRDIRNQFLILSQIWQSLFFSLCSAVLRIKRPCRTISIDSLRENGSLLEDLHLSGILDSDDDILMAEPNRASPRRTEGESCSTPQEPPDPDLIAVQWCQRRLLWEHLVFQMTV